MRRNGEDRTCICGTVFHVSISRIAEGKGKFCSKKCHYENAQRPSGLKYQIKVQNKTWFPKGHMPVNSIPKGTSLSPSTQFKVGSIPWLKGKKHPIYGEKHHNWKGGISPLNKMLRESPLGREWRRSVLRRDDFTCVMCGKRGVHLHVDHIKPFAYFPELRFELSNGRALCIPCHKGKTLFGFKARQAYE